MLIVTALGGFIRSFLTNDIKILTKKWDMNDHCAATITILEMKDFTDYFRDNNVIFASSGILVQVNHFQWILFMHMFN